jgi:hypothetical protein
MHGVKAVEFTKWLERTGGSARCSSAAAHPGDFRNTEFSTELTLGERSRIGERFEHLRSTSLLRANRREFRRLRRDGEYSQGLTLCDKSSGDPRRLGATKSGPTPRPAALPTRQQ